MVNARGNLKASLYKHVFNNCTTTAQGRDILGQVVSAGDVVLTVIDDKLVLVEVKEIVESAWWGGNDNLRYIFLCQRYRSRRKVVDIKRGTNGIFKVGPELIASAVLSGRLQ